MNKQLFQSYEKNRNERRELIERHKATRWWQFDKRWVLESLFYVKMLEAASIEAMAGGYANISAYDTKSHE